MIYSHVQTVFYVSSICNFTLQTIFKLLLFYCYLFLNSIRQLLHLKENQQKCQLVNLCIWFVNLTVFYKRKNPKQNRILKTAVVNLNYAVRCSSSLLEEEKIKLKLIFHQQIFKKKVKIICTVNICLIQTSHYLK